MKDRDKYFDGRLLELAAPTPRMVFSSAAQIGQLIAENKPAIFTNALSGWPAFGKWGPNYFRSRWGNNAVLAHETTWAGKSPYLHVDEDKALKKMSEFIDASSEKGDYDFYLNQADAMRTFPGSLADLRYETLVGTYALGLGANHRLVPNVWMGTPGTRSGLHFDTAHNLIGMFHGRKAMMLVDPAVPRRLYPFRSHPTKSRIDPATVDWSRFRNLSRASIQIDTLSPGDVLFLPNGWWHYFVSLDLSISTSCWFEWNAAPRKSPTLTHLQFLCRCGPSYVLHLLYQLVWFGILRRPFERHALTPPPMGWTLWQQLHRR